MSSRKGPQHLFGLILSGVWAAFILGGNTFLLAKELMSAAKALQDIFPLATSFEAEILELDEKLKEGISASAAITFDETHAPRVRIHTVLKNGEVIGYGLEDTVVGKWGPIHYLVGVDPEGTVREVIVLSYDEIRGKPVAKRRFLRQYQGKTPKDPLRLRKDIDGISGATISSRSLTDGVRKLLFIFAAWREINRESLSF